MHRFFIEEPNLHVVAPGDSYVLPDAIARQVRDVLHLRIGEQLVLFNPRGTEYICIVTHSHRKTGVEVRVEETRAGKPESPVKITLYQGLLKSARFETILEKCTELGVSSFAPILCRRSMSGLEDAGPTKIQRWQRIIQEATEQCGRSYVPTLLPIRPLSQALTELSPDTITLMPWEEEQAQSLHQSLQAVRQSFSTSPQETLHIALFIGPEGGLMEEEVLLAKQHGAQVVTLGSRILRAETAAMATVANVMYELEALF